MIWLWTCLHEVTMKQVGRCFKISVVSTAWSLGGAHKDELSAALEKLDPSTRFHPSPPSVPINRVIELCGSNHVKTNNSDSLF